MKKYLLGRMESLSAWIGMVGIILEIVLHLGHTSLVMLLLFVALIVIPEASIRELFKEWTTKVKDFDSKK